MSIDDYLHRRVMIADDLPNMRDDLRKILRNLGFTNIKEMPDGKSAYEELRFEAQNGKPYELIFSDINMPQMNGIALLKAVRFLDSYKTTPIFIVSTENEKGIIVRAILGGATDYIIKPYVPELVIEKLSSRLK